MPKIIVDKPFNFREGQKTLAYKDGKQEQEVSEACAAHAVNVLKVARYPKAKEEPKPAEPSSAG